MWEAVETEVEKARVVEIEGRRKEERSRKEMGKKRNESKKSSRRVEDLEQGGESSKVRGRS